MQKKLFNTDMDFYRIKFGKRAQKIPINAGFSCPNRDGSKSTGGCSYCNNDSFTPFYCNSDVTVTEQLLSGINYFSKRYKTDCFLAYFQAFTGTHASVDTLRQIYLYALEVPRIQGLIISTRPDCINQEKIDLLTEISQKIFVKIEIGIESLSDKALDRVNRQHSVKDTMNALELLGRSNIFHGAHLIATLPEDSHQNLLNSIKTLNNTSISFIKLHHLQIIKDTRMSKEFMSNPLDFNLFSYNGYIEFIAELIARLSPKIWIERFINRVPYKYLIAPKWNGIDEKTFREDLSNYMIKKRLFQGSLSL